MIIEERPRPRALVGVTVKVATSGGTMYVTVNVDAELNPFELFVRVGKTGNIQHADLEGLGRMVSYVMRIGADIRVVPDTLRGITSEPVWDNGTLVRSAPDGMAWVIQRVIDGEFEVLLREKLDALNRDTGQATVVETVDVDETDADETDAADDLEPEGNGGDDKTTES